MTHIPIREQPTSLINFRIENGYYNERNLRLARAELVRREKASESERLESSILENRANRKIDIRHSRIMISIEVISFIAVVIFGLINAKPILDFIYNLFYK